MIKTSLLIYQIYYCVNKIIGSREESEVAGFFVFILLFLAPAENFNPARQSLTLN